MVRAEDALEDKLATAKALFKAEVERAIERGAMAGYADYHEMQQLTDLRDRDYIAWYEKEGFCFIREQYCDVIRPGRLREGPCDLDEWETGQDVTDSLWRMGTRCLLCIGLDVSSLITEKYPEPWRRGADMPSDKYGNMPVETSEKIQQFYKEREAVDKELKNAFLRRVDMTDAEREKKSDAEDVKA